MTADNVVEIDYGLAAWNRIASHGNPTLRDRRAAALYAAQQTALDPDWLTFERSARIYDSIPRLAALPDIDANWRALVAACRSQHGPLMAAAVDALIGGPKS